MNASKEIEIKREVRDARALKRRLAELGWRRVKARDFESTRLLDFPNLALRQAQRVLRLRFVDGKCLLTFKGAPARPRHYKVRTELETKVEDGRGLKEILESAGLREVFRYDKYRTEYAPGAGSKDILRPEGAVRRKRGSTRRALERRELV